MTYHTETAEVTEGHLEEKEVQCLFNLLPSWAPRAPRPLPVISFFDQKPLEGTWPWRWWKIKDKWRERKKQYRFFKKLLGAFNNFRHLLANSINQFCNLRTFTSVLLLCFVNYLFFCHLYIFFSWYCKIAKKSKTKTCPFVDPSESSKIRGS